MILQDHLIKESSNIKGGGPSGVVIQLSLVAIGICGGEDVFSVSHDIAKPHDYGNVTLWVEAAQGKSTFCGRGDQMVLVCLAILQDHLIKRSSKIMVRRPSRLVTIPPSSVAIGTLVVET